jgi:exonuclease III
MLELAPRPPKFEHKLSIYHCRRLQHYPTSKRKKRRHLVQDPSREHLEDLISSLDLSDIKPKKNKYTWTNKREGKGHIAARLDKFLVSNHYLEDNISLLI